MVWQLSVGSSPISLQTQVSLFHVSTIVYAYYDDLVHADRMQLLLGVLTPHRAGDAQLPTRLHISYESSANSPPDLLKKNLVLWTR